MKSTQYFCGPDSIDLDLKRKINETLFNKKLKHPHSSFGFYGSCYYYWDKNGKLNYDDFKPKDMELIPFQEFVDWILDLKPKDANYEIF